MLVAKIYMCSAANVPVHAHIFNEMQWCAVQTALLCLGSVFCFGQHCLASSAVIKKSGIGVYSQSQLHDPELHWISLPHMEHSDYRNQINLVITIVILRREFVKYVWIFTLCWPLCKGPQINCFLRAHVDGFCHDTSDFMGIKKGTIQSESL